MAEWVKMHQSLRLEAGPIEIYITQYAGLATWKTWMTEGDYSIAEGTSESLEEAKAASIEAVRTILASSLEALGGKVSKPVLYDVLRDYVKSSLESGQDVAGSLRVIDDTAKRIADDLLGNPNFTLV